MEDTLDGRTKELKVQTKGKSQTHANDHVGAQWSTKKTGGCHRPRLMIAGDGAESGGNASADKVIPYRKQLSTSTSGHCSRYIREVDGLFQR